ncbi:helix-turn-helix transcriptional regulator [candidate division KSB1 bacterium]|nr:helix-turn-helix transcriptional regulator [candidate division KSB1 bacterium]
MPSEVNTLLLATKLKNKRGRRGLREVAKEIGGVSASTLSRIEQGKLPDLEIFFKICNWLKINPEMFMSNSKKSNFTKDKETTQDKIEVHLRADKTLSKDTAEALIKMIDLAYNAEININNQDQD